MNSIIESLHFWKKLMKGDSPSPSPKDFWPEFNKYQLFLGLGRDSKSMMDYLESTNNG